MTGPLGAVVLGAIPIGTAIGFMSCPTLRLAGIDFRPWFRQYAGVPAIEAEDNSWIGRVRRTTHWLAGAGAAALAVACGLFWHDPMALVGLALGFVAAHVLSDLTWWTTLAVTQPLAPPPPAAVAPPAAPPVSRLPTRRRLVICCDGTWNWPKPGMETNVIRLVRAIDACDGAISQIVHYQHGMGTGNFLDRLVGGGAGLGLANAVKAAYGFLADNYQAGDEIHVFGFSRGAYTARSVAGFIGSVGMVRKREMEHFEDVWDAYTDRKKHVDPAGYKARLNALAPDRHRPCQVDIECIGIWDTVGSLGVPGARICASIYAFHDLQLGRRVRHAFHALALNERRGSFQPAIWFAHSDPHVPQTLEQVWFPGVHSNVGGGYPRHGLSDAALLWMVSRIVAHGLLAIDMNGLARSLDCCEAEAYPLGWLENSRTWFWRLLSCPILRPVCQTDDSERIHVSAWDRSATITTPRDPFRRKRARDWLAQIPPDRRVYRSAIERTFPVRHAPPAGGEGWQTRGLKWCNWLAAKLAGFA